MNKAPQYQQPVLVDSNFSFENHLTEGKRKNNEKEKVESIKRVKSQTPKSAQDNNNRQNPNEHNTTHKLMKIPPPIKREDPLFYFTQTTNPPTYYAYLAHDKTEPFIMQRCLERKHEDEQNDDDSTKMSPEHWHHAYADSGANISIVTPTLVKSLNLAIKKFNTPVRIRFGQGQVATATHYTVVSWLGRAAIMDVPHSIISISAIMARAPLEVRFNALRLKIVDMGDSTRPTLYRKKISANGLYEIDLHKFLTLKPPKSAGHYKDIAKVAGSKCKLLKRIYQDSDSDEDEDEDEDKDEDENKTRGQSEAAETFHTCFYVSTTTLAVPPEALGKREGKVEIEVETPDEQDSEKYERNEREERNGKDTLADVEDTPTNPKTHSRGTRISRELLNKVIWLHKCTGHQGREAMARAVRNGAWAATDPEISEAVIRKVFLKLPCTACQ